MAVTENNVVVIERGKSPEDKKPLTYEDVERFMADNNWMELMNVAKTFKLNGNWTAFIGYNYCQRRCTFLHELLRRSNTPTIITILDYLLSVMGKDNFDKIANEDFDKAGRNCLIIAAKHCEPMLVLSLIQDYEFDSSHYSSKGGMSALSYVLKRKKNDLAFECISRMDPKNFSEEERTYFRADLDLYHDNLIEADIINSHYLDALTEEYMTHGRISKVIPPVYVAKQSYEDWRLKQLLRHVSSQLFFRWRYHLKVNDLEDVQILVVDQPLRKPIIFLATSPIRLSGQVKDDFKLKTFHTMLTALYKSQDDTDCEIVERLSRRFSKKIKARVWGKNALKYTKQYRTVSRLLDHDERKLQKVVFNNKSVGIPYFEPIDNTAYLVTVDDMKYHDSHAECLLAAIYDYFKIEQNIKSTIYGKGRPCVCCLVRIKEENVDEYNNHPGLLQLRNLKKTLSVKESRIQYIKMVYETPLHITICNENGSKRPYPDYDTESDSDIESRQSRRSSSASAST